MKDLTKQIEEAAEAYQFETKYRTVSCKRQFKAGALSQAAKEYWQQGIYTEGKVREIAIHFFYWWYNWKGGTNTEEAFDEWWKLNKAFSYEWWRAVGDVAFKRGEEQHYFKNRMRHYKIAAYCYMRCIFIKIGES